MHMKNCMRSMASSSLGRSQACEVVKPLLEGCMATILVLAQSGFHFKPFTFCSAFGLSALQAPSLVMVKLETLFTPFASKHFCMKRSSPQGPYFQSGSWPFQSRVFLQSSRLLRKVLNPVAETTSRLPKNPNRTFLQFSTYTPSAGTLYPLRVSRSRWGKKTASASTLTNQSEPSKSDLVRMSFQAW